MASRRIYIGYVDRAGTPDVAQVSVYRDKWAQGARKFYASGKWGCGKNAASIEGAVRMLVQDMAIVLWVGRDRRETP